MVAGVCVFGFMRSSFKIEPRHGVPIFPGFRFSRVLDRSIRLEAEVAFVFGSVVPLSPDRMG